MVQPKLIIGRHEDRYGQEVDPIANQEVPLKADTVGRSPQQQVQLQQNPDKKTPKESVGEDVIQGKPENTALSQFSLEKQRPNKTGLPDHLKTGIENLSGYSMDDVRVHYNSDKPAQLQAHAYTQGTEIHVALGQEKHLPHEAWHVVQQKQGRVQPTGSLGNIPINSDQALEAEATAQGKKAAQLMSAPGHAKSYAFPKRVIPYGNVVQATGGSGWELLGTANPRRYLPEWLGGYSQETLDEIYPKDAQAQKEKIINNVIKLNLNRDNPGWFDLEGEELQQYVQQVFGFLEKIRQTDMTTLMLAHQQVNDEAKGTPEDKVTTLTEYIEHIDAEIAKLSAFDEQVVQDNLTKKKEEYKKLNEKLKNRKYSNDDKTKSMLRKRLSMEKEIDQLTNQLQDLRSPKVSDLPEIQKLKKLKQHKARMKRELEFQKAQLGQEGVNIDFLNTSDIDDKGNEYVRVYMAIVAPNYDNRFKDFYLNDNNRLTYSANDKIMWVSFGTPLRTLSWFQKYALAAATDRSPTNSVPLIRSFKLPMSYFQKHIQQITTEDPKTKKGTTLESEGVDLSLTNIYGDNQFGNSYQSEVAVIDPYPMNVDVKYPNQFGLVRIKHAVELGAPDHLFDKTRKHSQRLQADFDSKNFDQQIQDINTQIQALNTEQSEIDDHDLNDQTEQEIEQQLKNLLFTLQDRPLRGNSQAIKYIENLKDDQDILEVDRHIKERALKLLMHEKLEPKKEQLNHKKRQLIDEKKKQQADLNRIPTGDNQIKSHVSKTSQALEAQVKKSEGGNMTSTAMADLLKHAVPGSFQTIALANDRKYEHVASREGELQDYGDFLTSMGLNPDREQPEFHLLDQDNTALHHQGKEGKWASATPTQTEELYLKMRFFFHALDSQTKDMVQFDKTQLADISLDDPNLTLDSHITLVMEQIQNNPEVNAAIKKLAEVSKATNLEEQLSTILNRNHFTPADVLGLPEKLDSKRKDRHGNTMVKAAAETYFAEQQLSADSSLDFVAAQAPTLIQHLDNKTYSQDFTKQLLENDYLKRDIQEILGKKAQNSKGIKKSVDFNKKSIVEVLETMKNIKNEQDKHKQLRMVYLFFHIMRPLAQLLGKDSSKDKSQPTNYIDTNLLAEATTKNELLVNNRKEQLDYFNFLNPMAKGFGIMEQRRQQQKKNKLMPYDIYRSSTRYVPREGNKMTDYMKALDMPFVGGVSGTTRDQTQVLEHIFDQQTMKKHYWDFQLMNAAFMIANGYHSFFETIYVAARYDHTDTGTKILNEFSKMRAGGYSEYEAYKSILRAIGAKSDIFEGFERWYANKVKK
ncbi:MAG: DUF4157 domain-containing protein [Moorea sp. SIO3G5]|nr:DUF4157 domain-containing protein [Moorena sp. SIO3G5]